MSRVWDAGALDPAGLAAAAVASVTFAAYLLGSGYLGRFLPTLSVAAYGFAFSALCLLVVFPGAAAARPSARLLVELGWLVILGTVVPFLLEVDALKMTDAGTVGVVATLEPVVAAAVAWIWLGQQLTCVAGGRWRDRRGRHRSGPVLHRRRRRTEPDRVKASRRPDGRWYDGLKSQASSPSSDCLASGLRLRLSFDFATVGVRPARSLHSLTVTSSVAPFRFAHFRALVGGVTLLEPRHVPACLGRGLADARTDRIGDLGGSHERFDHPSLSWAWPSSPGRSPTSSNAPRCFSSPRSSWASRPRRWPSSPTSERRRRRGSSPWVC